MKIIKWKFGGKPPEMKKEIAIAIGNFDGIHQGHVKLLETAKSEAYEKKLGFGVVTFEPHPRDFFNSGNSSFKLLDSEEKENLLSEIGVDYLIIIEFNKELKNCSANDFLSKILNETFKVTKMFAGSNFRFGKNREGTIENKRDFASNFGLEIIAVDLKKTNSIKVKETQTISSQAIRSLIKAGQLNLANNLLGRNWCITGIVQKGKQQGREIGFPTANLNIQNFLKPPLGVYVTRLKIIDEKKLENLNDWLPSISNIGTRPTVSGDSINLETHIINLNNKDIDMNLYDKRIKVEFLDFLRPEKKFNSLSELKKQIEFDRKKACDFHHLK